MPGDAIQLKTLPNMRDLGGYATDGGRTVRKGVLFRSAALNDVNDADLKTLEGFGIKTVFDLRSAKERGSRPDRVPKGVRHVATDVLADSAGGETFREVVSLPSALKAYRTFFLELTEDANRPALFHCGGGATRTGWAAAATLLLLGVSGKDVMTEYVSVDGAEQEHLKAGLGEMDKQYGSIESYFTVGLGIGPAGREELRTALLQ
jgi:protein-tyrosine phosphatase